MGADFNPIKQPNMFWLLKVLNLYSDKLNRTEWCVLGPKSLCPHFACMSFFRPKNWVVISYPVIECLHRCWISPSGLNCDSNNCSLCLCVRLCWGRGALWGTLDSQVTRLEIDFDLLLLSVSTCSFSANVHNNTPCLPILCTKHPQLPLAKNTSPPCPEWHKAVI